MIDLNIGKLANAARLRKNNPKKYGMTIHLEPKAVELLLKYYSGGSDSDAVYNMLKQIDEMRVDEKHEIVVLEKTAWGDIKKSCPPWMNINEYLFEVLCAWDYMKSFYMGQLQIKSFFDKMKEYRGDKSNVQERRD